MIAISSLIRSNEASSSSMADCGFGRCRIGRPIGAIRLCFSFPLCWRDLRSRLDFARRRRRDFENSLTALKQWNQHPNHCMSVKHKVARIAHIFLSVLIYRKVYRAERAATNLLLYQVLIDTMLGGTIIFTVTVLRTCIACFL